MQPVEIVNTKVDMPLKLKEFERIEITSVKVNSVGHTTFRTESKTFSSVMIKNFGVAL